VFTAIVVELSELMQELDWKPWKQKGIVDKAKVREEMADVIAFIGVLLDNIIAHTEITLEEIAVIFARKTELNIARANGAIENYVPRNEF
jgi:dimeric dUTPase (all-alpha-NTP-PPase superfamily)